MINLSAHRQAQLDYIGLSGSDLSLLAANRTVFEKIVNEVVNRLYDSIERQQELMDIIGKHSTIERLKLSQKQYFLSLTEGAVDEAYIENRIKIGLIHSRVGLNTNFYLGTYMVYLDIAADMLRQVLPDQWSKVLHALSKMFNLDSQLVLEAYNIKEKETLQNLSDNQQHLLTAITDVAQNLTGMIHELNDNTNSISQTAKTTAAAQEKSHALLDELEGEVRKIEEMSLLVNEISDRTHLLGLNAAIEAAHAGEMGRGFEVVAGEVRKLAANSRNALEHISDTVTEITAKLESVRKESEATSSNAQQQVLRSEELANFVNMIRDVADELEQLHNKD